MQEAKVHEMPKPTGKPTASEKPECFVVMPIAEADGYATGHFLHVYKDIIVPACEKSGFKAIRADEVKQTNLIHLDILQKLLDSPMCLCDLSTRNPNVLFELALRQAFDKPVTLIQETGTKPIFDIAPLRYTEYRKERIYHEVIEDQEKICDSVRETFESHQKGKGINSIVRLLSLAQPAKLVETGEIDRQSDLQALILAEMEQMRAEFRTAVRTIHDVRSESTPSLKFSRRYVELQHSITRIENLIRNTELTHAVVSEIDCNINEVRGVLRTFMSAPSIAENEIPILIEADARLDRIEYEYRRLLEGKIIPKSKRGMSQM